MLTLTDAMPVVDYKGLRLHHVLSEYRELMIRLEQAGQERKEQERHDLAEFNRTHCSYCRRPEIESRTLRLCSECNDAV